MTQLRDASAEPIPGFVLDNVVREAQSGPISRLVQTAGEMGQGLDGHRGLRDVVAREMKELLPLAGSG